MVGHIADRIVFAMTHGTAGKPTLRIAKVTDIQDASIRGRHVLLRDDIVYLDDD